MDQLDTKTQPIAEPERNRRKWIIIGAAALLLAGIGAAVGAVVVSRNSNNTDTASSSSSSTVTNNNSSPTTFQYRPFTTPGVIGYWANWGEASQPENMIDKLNLTGFNSVMYSFVFPTADGNLIPAWTYALTSSGSKQVVDSSEADAKWIPIMNGPVRNKYSNLRTIVSIGGWTGSTNFSSIATSPVYTAAFVKNIHAFLDKHGFDGVDLDWEYPGGGGIDCLQSSTNDISNFVNLLSSLRTELGPTRHISIAVGAEPTRYTFASKNYLTEYAKYVNYFGLMTYDVYGAWNAYSDLNSPLSSSPTLVDPNYPMSIQSFVADWKTNGVSTAQIVTGLAFYGRSMSVVSKGSNNGLYQPCMSSANADLATTTPTPCPSVYGDFLDAKPACDTCGVCGALSGQWMYYSLRGAFGKQEQAPLSSGTTTPTPQWTREYFDSLGSSTVFATQFRNYSNYFIGYDDNVSIKAKARWAKGAGLGGQMIWELSSDYRGELANAALDATKNPKVSFVTGLAFYGLSMTVVSSISCDSSLNIPTTPTPCPAVYDFLDTKPLCDTCVWGVPAGYITPEFFVLLLSPVKAIHPTLTLFRVRLITQNKYHNIGKAKRLLGYKARVSLGEGIKRSVKWFKDEEARIVAAAKTDEKKGK
ncbi:UNVERIFIED_CONTAM: hypothetical protein HDU68_012707 [Siphonaria sp. JEL0065]|nr:hypothetical protein HDU68_012707 [Siphonaria sp. JEL0065]